MTVRPSSDDLFADDDEPKANSPEDLGQSSPRLKPERPDGVDERPPRAKSFGEPSPGPDPIPDNHARSAIQIDDARKFVKWIHEQDLPIHEDVTVGHVLVAFSGWGTEKLGWVCRAVRQAGVVPKPSVMREAALANDVGLLRQGE